MQPLIVHQQAKPILESIPNAIYLLLSPNIPAQKMSERAKEEDIKRDFETWEKTGHFVVSNGDGWLSKWFLNVFREKFWIARSTGEIERA